MNAKLKHITGSIGEICKGHVKVKLNSTLVSFTLEMRTGAVRSFPVHAMQAYKGVEVWLHPF
jgi:hypothetical protein